MSFSSIRSQLSNATPPARPNYVLSANLELEFVKKHTDVYYRYSGSWHERQLYASRPDSIRFRKNYGDELLKKLTQKLEAKFGTVYDPQWELVKKSNREEAIKLGQPINPKWEENENAKYYTSNPYTTFEINAEDAEKFLDILLVFKREFPSFSISKTQYHQLLDNLVSNGYLAPELKNYYLTEMPTDWLLLERGRLAQKTKNFEEAITIAKVYKEKSQVDSFIYPARASIAWLLKAQEYDPIKFSWFQKSGELSKFLQSFTHLTYCESVFFTEGRIPILNYLKNTITNLSFDPYFVSANVNQHLGTFIAECTVLKSLTISRSRDLDADDMRHIAAGLKVNSSLEELDISEQPIGDEGLNLLLKALASNPNTKLRVLNLFNTRLTERGQKLLEQFLETNKTLENINVNWNHVSPEKIDQLTKRNQLAREGLQKPEYSTPEFSEDLRNSSKRPALR